MKNISFILVLLLILGFTFAQDKTKSTCDAQLQQQCDKLANDAPKLKDCQNVQKCVNLASNNKQYNFQTSLENTCSPSSSNSNYFILYYNQYLSCTWTNKSQMLILSIILSLLPLIL
ncbi:hypothetical protein ABPG74_001603 [Tetrahymena malaccensis]